MKCLKEILITTLIVSGLCVIGNFPINAQNTATIKNDLQSVVTSTVPPHMGIGKIKVKDLKINKKSRVISINLNENYSYTPINATTIATLKDKIKDALGSEYSKYSINVLIEDRDINDFISLDKVARQQKKDEFITPLDPSARYSKGLDGNIIAMWQSHGWYFEPKLNRWEWQRARIFQTVEDLYTQSYVMPFLMPMLENAGAYVISPRERDVNIHEVIVDNDATLAQAGYIELNGNRKWVKGNEVFAYKHSEYHNNQNPFQEGTYREVKTTDNIKKISTAQWNANIPVAGEYAVYISYKTLSKSATDAVYTINYAGGSKQFKVNQKMGGGTWIYLGHFQLDKGASKLPVVELSNYSNDNNSIITADAVKIGGGYGNIARIVKSLSPNVKSSEKNNDNQKINTPAINYQYQLSNYPRFTEGARYWLQWAGVPDSIYSPSENVNDYTDDYKCRGTWVNYLAGGSKVLPKNKGLNIPVDLSFAFHTDAGTTRNDSIIGTLGIYYSNNNGKYADGTPRIQSRKLTDLIMTNIVSDVRKQYEPNWMRRGMWDKSYYEARVPEVPSMLLELLSHQNFADMKYGLDPKFRFSVSRAIYKGMLQFLAERDGRDYVVQPLPVKDFSITNMSGNRYALKWNATIDTLCDNANPTKYIIYERINDKQFKELDATSITQYNVLIKDNDIHSYRIVAVNDGGRSFPSEILALGIAPNSRGEVLVVNGFTRISGPDWFEAGDIAGFYDARDHGVPYEKDINFIGSQFEYRRTIPWMDDDAAGFGASRANYETKVIAGNTFDYPYIHGEAIKKAGFSFISTGIDAITNGDIDMSSFKTADLILGKQKETMNGRGAYANQFKAFPQKLQQQIAKFCNNGGSIFVSGAFVATDIWDKKNVNKEDIKFAEDVLGYKWRVGQASVTGEAYSVPTIFPEFNKGEYSFSNELNEDMYVVESPDSLYPADSKTGSTFMRYTENNLVAGIVVTNNNYKTCIIGFPFETIKTSDSRSKLMSQILNFFDNKK
ncbi:MAG: xanthan lyase [Muribaculaceae bacterium]